MLSQSICSDLSRICPGTVATRVPLREISRWRIGGEAEVIVRPGSIAQIAELRRYLHCHDLPSVVIGATTNLLFSDEGLSVVCIQIDSSLSGVSRSGEEFTVEAGLWVPRFSRLVMHAGMTGAEHICGIPGTMGGLICMNGGSMRREIGSAVVSVTSINQAGDIVTRNAGELGFGYRRSVFQDIDEIIASACLRFVPAGDKSEVRRAMISILADRRRKFPLRMANCGSVFKSDSALYADHGPPGALIERLGFKGRSVGGALVSPMHANFIVNAGSARARDVLTLIAEIKAAVLRETGLDLAAEVKYVQPSGKVVSADSLCEVS